MNLTKEQAIEGHRKMWNWIADKIEEKKCVDSIEFLKFDYCIKVFNSAIRTKLVGIILGFSSSGNYNSGSCNSGDHNSGDCNSGDFNSGDCNSGYYNSGSYNSGSCNSGSCNSGSRNSGDFNSGYRNSGSFNSGNYNSGDWNKISFSNGCFNTELPKIFLFNKPCDWTFRDWLDSDARRILLNCPSNILSWVAEESMTDEEKKQHPAYCVTGGFLKYTQQRAERQIWWDNLSYENKNTVMQLPNFDRLIFEEITGINVEIDVDKKDFRRTSEENSKFVKTTRYTEYHCGKAVIKDKAKLSEAMEKLARLEDLEEQGKLKIKYEIPLLFDNF